MSFWILNDNLLEKIMDFYRIKINVIEDLKNSFFNYQLTWSEKENYLIYENIFIQANQFIDTTFWSNYFNIIFANYILNFWYIPIKWEKEKNIKILDQKKVKKLYEKIKWKNKISSDWLDNIFSKDIYNLLINWKLKKIPKIDITDELKRLREVIFVISFWKKQNTIKKDNKIWLTKFKEVLEEIIKKNEYINNDLSKEEKNNMLIWTISYILNPIIKIWIFYKFRVTNAKWSSIISNNIRRYW